MILLLTIVTTRLRDIVFKNADAPVITNDIRPNEEITLPPTDT